MKGGKKSKALVPLCLDRPMTPAERQRKRRKLQGTGQMLVKSLALDEATIFLGLFDKFWLDREDGDDPRKLVAGLQRWINYMFETDEHGNFFRMPNAPEVVSRVTAIEMEITYNPNLKN
jgi:hypothetical protein